jgi:hypothetical protein
MENNVKNKLNIVGTGYIKENRFGGDIISFLPDVPLKANLCDLLFILTIPENNNYSPAYCRLQDKSRMTYDPKFVAGNFIAEEDFSEIREMGIIKDKGSLMLICAPRSNVVVSLDKLVVIGTIPNDLNATKAPFYFKKKVYNTNKSELETASVKEAELSQASYDYDCDRERDNKFVMDLNNLPF